jgi:hypothetical protein
MVTGGYQRVIVWDVAAMKPVLEVKEGLLSNCRLHHDKGNAPHCGHRNQ